MASLFARIRNVVAANAHHQVDQIENPQIMANQVLRDLGEEVHPRHAVPGRLDLHAGQDHARRVRGQQADQQAGAGAHREAAERVRAGKLMRSALDAAGGGGLGAARQTHDEQVDDAVGEVAVIVEPAPLQLAADREGADAMHRAPQGRARYQNKVTLRMRSGRQIR